MSTSAVADGGSGLEGVGHQVEDGDLVLALGGLVDVGDVRGVVLVVMDLHGGGVTEKETFGVEEYAYKMVAS